MKIKQNEQLYKYVHKNANIYIKMSEINQHYISSSFNSFN